MVVFPKSKPLLPGVEARRATVMTICWAGAVALSLLVATYNAPPAALRAALHIPPGIKPDSSLMVQMTQATPTIQASLSLGAEEPTPSSAALSGQMVIWFSASAMPGQDSPGAVALAGIVRAFELQHSLDLVIRLKRTEGIGGIYQTLQTAHQVAPSTIPDLVVVSSAELSKIIDANLASGINTVSITEIAPIYADLFISELDLSGKETHHGLPFLLDIHHLVMRKGELPEPPPDTFEVMAKLDQPYTFPAKAVNGVNGSVLAHYSALGGRVRDENGKPMLDRIPLIAFLEGVNSAAANKTILPEVLTYTSPTQYWGQFTSGRIALAQVNSSLYLAAAQSGTDLTMIPAPLPAFEGHAPLIVDGYWWVITTADPLRIAEAQAIIAHFMDPTRHALLSEAMGMLPSRRESLRRWRNSTYAQFAATILEGKPTPLPYSVDATVAAALQTAFEAVLNGQQSIPRAVEDALAAVE